jgi:hypothetical protein
MDRRRFLLGAAGVGTVAVAGPWVAAPAAASDDELAYANLGVSAELLLVDFTTRGLDAKQLDAAGDAALRRSRIAARQHAAALSALLVGAGQTAPDPADFEFAWPEGSFATAASTRAAGLTVLRALLGAYQTAAATVVEPTYRVLYASLVASVAQQIGALGGRAGIEQFPVAVDLEAASTALEEMLG